MAWLVKLLVSPSGRHRPSRGHHSLSGTYSVVYFVAMTMRSRTPLAAIHSPIQFSDCSLWSTSVFMDLVHDVPSPDSRSRCQWSFRPQRGTRPAAGTISPCLRTGRNLPTRSLPRQRNAFRSPVHGSLPHEMPPKIRGELRIPAVLERILSRPRAVGGGGGTACMSLKAPMVVVQRGSAAEEGD